VAARSTSWGNTHDRHMTRLWLHGRINWIAPICTPRRRRRPWQNWTRRHVDEELLLGHCPFSACKGGVGCGARNDGADDEEAIDVDGMASRPARPWSCTSLDIACWAVTMVGQVMGTGGRRRRC